MKCSALQLHAASADCIMAAGAKGVRGEGGRGRCTDADGNLDETSMRPGVGGTATTPSPHADRKAQQTGEEGDIGEERRVAQFPRSSRGAALARVGRLWMGGGER